MNIDLTTIETTSWYRQATAAKLIHLTYPFRSCLALSIRGEQLPIFYDQIITWLSPRHEFSVYFGTDCLERVARFYIDRALADADFAPDLHEFWKQHHYQPLISEFNAIDTSSRSLPEMINQLKALAQRYSHSWNEVIFHDSFDYAGELLLKEKAGVNATEVAQAIQHPFQSPYQTERLALWTIAEAVLKRGESAQIVAAETADALPEVVQIALKRHAQTYHWIRNDYAFAHRLESDDFLLQLKELVNNVTRASEERQFVAAMVNPRTIPNFNNLNNQLVVFLSLIGVWRDERKALQQQAVAAVQTLIGQIAEASNASVRDLEWLEWFEIEPFLAGDRGVADRLEQRKTGVLLFTEGRILIERYGADGLAVKQSLDRQVDTRSLRGRVAYPGYVTGTARLIFDQRGFHKFQPGDILVAPNTRPEYLPIMRLAAAVVTEEGGLTSHAAIVARELSVPTIVGVQGAITQLHDGDQIEVDAKSGVVRKLP